MKKSLFNILGAAAMLGLTLSSFQGCKLGDPLEGVAITVKADAVSPPHVYKVKDAKTGYSADAFDNATVEITGPNSTYLYNPDGKRLFKIVDGRIGISIRKGFIPSPSNPLKFKMSLNIPGYLSKELSYSIVSLYPTYNEIAVVNLNDLTKASSTKDTSIVVPATGNTEEIIIKIDSTTERPQGVTVTIPKGTIFKDEDGNVVGGTISSKIIYSEPKTAEDYAMSLLTPFNSKYIDSNNQEVEAFILEENVLYTQFFSSGKALRPVTGRSAITPPPLPPIPAPRVCLDDIGPTGLKLINGLYVTTDNIACGSVCNSEVINFTITNLSTMGAHYQFRQVHLNRQGEVLNQTEITPSPSGFSANVTTGTCGSPVKVQYKKRNATTWLDPNGSSIDLPFESLEELTVYFAVVCESGSVERPVLAAGTPIYLIDNALYKQTPNPGHSGRLIFPIDAPVGGVQWRRYDVSGSVTRNGKVWNVVKIPKSEIENNVTYRAAYYRGLEREDSDADGIFYPNAPKLSVPDKNAVNEFEFELTLKTCD